MKKKYWKYIAKSVKHDFSRIITITSIVGLGIGFLVGLLSTTPDLFASMDNYYDKSNFADINVRSTIGFHKDTPNDLLAKVDGIQNVMMTYEEEKYINIGTNKFLGKISYRPLLNQENATDILTLESGAWPQSSNECVMLVPNKGTANYKIGQPIDFSTNEKESKTAKIVGLVRDPNYVTYQSEQSIISGGTIKSYVYFDISTLPPEIPVYTNLYIKLRDTTAKNSFSKSYETIVSEKMNEIYSASKSIIDKQVDEIKDDVVKIATEEAIAEFKKQLKEAFPSADEATLNGFLDFIKQQEIFKTAIKNKVDEKLNEQFGGYTPAWYVLNRDAIKSAYVFKTDALKVQTIAMIFPPFFFLIALLVCMSSMSRIITKDRQIIGTYKALGFKKSRIALKYLLYGIGSALIGSILGVGIGLFLIPWALMSVYSTIYYFQTMQFVFTAGYVFGFTLLMIGLITALVLGVVYSNLKEPAATLMAGMKSPKAGKKILIERIPVIWNHLKFKWKSTFRNIFRYKKNLLMMIIGVGGCTGLLLTGFGIKDSFSVISKDQYRDIIQYDAVVTIDSENFDPLETFSEKDTSYMAVDYMHGTVHGEDDIQVEIFGSDSQIKNYVGFYKTDGSPLKFNQNSVIISDQLAKLMGIKIRQQQFLQVSTNYGSITLLVNGICRNYVSNYIYLGEEAFKTAFKEQANTTSDDAYLLTLNGLNESEKQHRLNTYTIKDGVKAVIPTSETRQTYDDIVSNLGMIVALITLLSGALAAIVIYNLTDININERIREIATLRVCGYRRSEVLMYILREILIMSLIGILVGLGIGVFLHHFIISSIASIGINFSLNIHWSSYLITVAIATAFVLGISFCFYPKIKKVSMTESLKSVD